MGKSYFVRVEAEGRAAVLERILGTAYVPVQQSQPYRTSEGSWVYDLDPSRLAPQQKKRLAGYITWRFRVPFEDALVQLHRVTIDAQDTTFFDGLPKRAGIPFAMQDVL